MKPTALFLFASLLLSSCGQDAASKEAEARVSASIQQLLGTSNPAYINVVHNWYQSDVPNLIKLNPKTESIFQAHAALVQEQTRQLPVLSKHPMVKPGEATAMAGVYERAIAESNERVTELSQLAQAKTSMSEAEQLRYVSELADRQKQTLGLVQRYGQSKTATLAQRVAREKTRQYNLRMWGHE